VQENNENAGVANQPQTAPQAALEGATDACEHPIAPQVSTKPVEPTCIAAALQRGPLSSLKTLNPLTLALGLAITLFGAAAGFHYYVHSFPLTFAEGLKQVDILVHKGETANTVAQRIDASGIDLSALAFKTAMRVYGTPANIHAGRYRFEVGMTLKDVVERFSNGLVAHGKLRIPDGMNFRQLKALIDSHEDLLHKTQAMDDAAILHAIGAKEKHLEGLFSPDTYKFKTGVTDISVYVQAYEKQMKTLEMEWELRAPKLKLKTPYEALILASIIEKETGIHTDRYLVSSVFHNRLRIWMPLQTDPTVIYGMGEAFSGRLRKRDLQRPGPYNSYLNYGLPPTPIAMPSAASIHAALHPTDSKYLYFVARGDGTTVFSKTIDEHNVAVNRYQKNQKKKRKKLLQ